MGCFGGDKRRFKKLEENKKNLNNNNNDIAECSRTLKKNSSVKRFLENEQQHRDNKNIVGTNVKNSNNNIVVSRRLKARSNSLKRLLDNDHNQIGRNNNIASSSSRIKEEDQTQQHQAVTLEPETTAAGKEKEEIYSNKPLAKKFEDLNLRDNVRAKGKEAGHSNELKDTLEAKLTEAAKEASSSKDKLSLKLRDPNLKDDGRKSGELKGGSDATAEEEEETSHSDLFSQKFKDSNLKDSKRTHGKEARTFKYATLAKATGNFKSECFLGEGGFGKVYKGHLDEINQVVAIKQLDRHGSQGIREFVMEVLTLSLADHPNLVKLLGFCVDGDKRLLVYEYMPLGSLERYLHDLPPKQKPLDWNTRMKIASGAARGLEYLHDKIKPPVIYRDLKCANILLGDGYHPKLSDFGLAKVGPSGNKTHVSTRVMGTYGYCAPDYALTGQLNFKSDIYSFGVVLLELITGRKAFDRSKNGKEQSLVQWARPLFKDRKKFTLMADPLLEGQYPIRGLYQALAIAAMCIQEKASMRPAISDVVNALDFLASQTYNPSTRSEKQTGSIPSYSIAEKDSESLYFSLERNCHDEDDDNDDDEAKTAVANDDEAKNSFTDINREIKNL